MGAAHKVEDRGLGDYFEGMVVAGYMTEGEALEAADTLNLIIELEELGAISEHCRDRILAMLAEQAAEAYCDRLVWGA